MQNVRGIFLPDHETHLQQFLESGVEFAGRPTYQIAKFQAAFPWIKNFRHAVDIGAHVGLWSRVLERCFDKVSAFEPVEEHQQLFVKNVITDAALLSHVTLYPFALGNADGDVTLHTQPTSSGDTVVQTKGKGEHAATMHKLDSFALKDIDFVKIDCEGFEKFILLGGEKTIRQQRPCIIVEQKKGKASQFGLADTEACDLLSNWGAVQRQVISGDYIYSW